MSCTTFQNYMVGIAFHMHNSFPSSIPMMICIYTGVEDYLCPVDDVLITEVKEMYSEEPALVVKEFATFALAVLSEYNLPQPNTVEQGLEIFFLLTHIIDCV